MGYRQVPTCAGPVLATRSLDDTEAAEIAANTSLWMAVHDLGGMPISIHKRNDGDYEVSFRLQPEAIEYHKKRSA